MTFLRLYSCCKVKVLYINLSWIPFELHQDNLHNNESPSSIHFLVTIKTSVVYCLSVKSSILCRAYEGLYNQFFIYYSDLHHYYSLPTHLITPMTEH